MSYYKCHFLRALCFIFFVHFFAQKVFGQGKIQQFVQMNASRVNTIDPDSSDYSDLKSIGDAISDARIVMLGEQDHGDAPTFLAKTRLIKYLHEKKGFNVLAFETDFFGLNYYWKPRISEAEVDSIVRNTVYAMWSRCDACESLLYKYIPATQSTTHPLYLTGIDNATNLRRFMPALDSFIRNLNLPPGFYNEFSTQMLPMIRNWGRNAMDSNLNGRYLASLHRLKAQVQQVTGQDDFWVYSIDNLITADSSFLYSRTNYARHMNVRDERLAKNLKWLCEHKYPAEKIIVWAHNYHVSKYAGHYPEKPMDSLITMGTYFTNDPGLLLQTYIIGFTSYEGTAGRLFPATQYQVEKPKTNSFENWISKDLDFAFVDFKAFNKENPGETGNFYMSGATKGNWYHKNSKAQWNRIFDGVFFIRKMYPCQQIK